MGLVGKKKEPSPFIELKKCRALVVERIEAKTRKSPERDYWFGASSVIGTMVAEDVKTGEIRCV